VQYNDFGAYLVIITAIICSLFFSRSRLLKERILIMVIAMPVMWCLFATKSRGAWIGTVIAVLSMASLKSKRLLAAILVLLCVSPVFLPASVKSRFSDFSEAAKGGTTWERMKLWSGTIAMVKEHPILGFGVNTYTRNFPKYKPADYPDVRYTHNSYLQMGAEIGIVGAGIFLIFLVSTIISSARGIGMFKKGLPQDLYVGLYAGVIGFLFHCGVDTHLYSVTLSAFIFLYLGLMLALRRQAGYEDKA
jgi:putative inorganic carbon (HCO3(-)) transporter